MKYVDIHCLLSAHLMKKNNKLDYYRGKDCLKKICQYLKKQTKSIVDFEKKEMIELTEEENFKYYIGDKCYICEKPFYKDKKILVLK